ncbi:MAG: MBL fold metallo-hydrolase, partial [Bacillota bacterium]
MKVTFWGVRGSIPTPLTEGDVKEKMYRLLSLINSSDDTSTVEGRDKVLERFTESEPLLIGGNTSCIEVQADDKTLIFDMGSGIRRLGNHIAEDSKRGREIHIFLSHTHWDHINGFPFFLPAYLPDYKLHFYSIHPGLKEKLEIQQDPRFFPVKLEQMSSTKEFFQLKEDCELMVGDILIKNKQLFHPGNSYGYSVNVNGKKFVFATDSEYKVNSTEIM